MSRFGKLVCLSGTKAGEEYELGRELIIVGRSVDADLILDDQFASRRHVEIRYIDNAYQVRDLDSKNGVIIDGRRLAPGSICLAGRWQRDSVRLNILPIP